MSDKWIVTNHRFNEHATLDAAQAERDRLAGESPGKTFRVLRIKTGLRANGSFKEMAELLARSRAIIEAIADIPMAITDEIDALFAKVDYKPGETPPHHNGDLV